MEWRKLPEIYNAGSICKLQNIASFWVALFHRRLLDHHFPGPHQRAWFTPGLCCSIFPPMTHRQATKVNDIVQMDKPKSLLWNKLHFINSHNPHSSQTISCPGGEQLSKAPYFCGGKNVLHISPDSRHRALTLYQGRAPVLQHYATSWHRLIIGCATSVRPPCHVSIRVIKPGVSRWWSPGRGQSELPGHRMGPSTWSKHQPTLISSLTGWTWQWHTEAVSRLLLSPESQHTIHWPRLEKNAWANQYFWIRLWMTGSVPTTPVVQMNTLSTWLNHPRCLCSRAIHMASLASNEMPPDSFTHSLDIRLWEYPVMWMEYEQR